MPITSLRQLLESGIHYGHRVSRWNPKMRPFIYGKRNLIHIIDVRETVRGLVSAHHFVSKIVARGSDVLFVGTKRQARMAIKNAAVRCHMPYVCDRWLGGTLTNYGEIRSRLARLEQLEALEADGQLDRYSKKEASRLRREMNQIQRNLEGLRTMTRMPGVLFIVDPRREDIAVAEARRLGIPTVCLLDTDCDPDTADICIPGNDDAMRAIQVISSKIADAVLEGKVQRGEMVQPLKPAAGQRVESAPVAAPAAPAVPAAPAAPAVPADDAASAAAAEPAPEASA